MGDVWYNRWQRLKEQGILLNLCFYYKQICRLFVSLCYFRRTDLRIYPDARLGGIRCMHIGKNFISGRGLWLEVVTSYSTTKQSFTPKLIIGDRVNVGEYVHIGCNHHIEIGDDVLMGSKIYITDHNHGVYSGEDQDSPHIPPVARHLTEGESVIIGSRCWLGEFVTILPGVTIGEGCIVGSHSTVTHNIPANSIAVGSPARVVKTWNEENGQWVRV